MPRLSVVLLCFLPGLAGAASAPADGYVTYSGTAMALHSSRFLYGERHVLFYRAGRIAERIVLYTCADGSAFARKTVRYVDPIAPDFRLDDAANGMLEGIRSEPNGRTVFFRASQSSAEKSGPLPGVAGLVADAGFDEFVRTNWQRLMTDKTLSMPFLVPSRLTDYGFQVQHLRSEVTAGAPAEVFRLRLGGLWGWFLPGIDVYYSTADHVLVRYVGLSDLRDASGDNFKTEIVFPPTDRKAAEEASMRAAEQAALSACR